MTTILLLSCVLLIELPYQCAASQEKSGSTFAGTIKVAKWTEGELQPGDLTALDDAGEQLAADAERAFLLRICGRGPDIFNAALLRGLSSPLYVIADKKLLLPAGPPELRLANDFSEIVRLANKTKVEVFWISMKALGMMEYKPGLRGVVIEYAYHARAPEQGNDDGKTKAGSLFGGGYRVLVIREGTSLVFFEEPMIVS